MNKNLLKYIEEFWEVVGTMSKFCALATSITFGIAMGIKLALIVL